MRSLFAILFVFAGYVCDVKGQDLTGQWTGTAIDKSLERRQKLVLSITEGDSSFGGVLHWYSPETQTIRHIIVSGRFYGKDSILTVREDSTRQPSALKGPAGGFYVLFYRRKAGRRDMLEGHWQSNSPLAEHANDWAIHLEKKAPPFIPLPVAKNLHRKKDSGEVRQYQAMQTRESVVAGRIPLQGADTIRVALYDNGEIDGDSVSLYINNQLLAQHVLLTADAKVIQVPIDKRIAVNKLILFAENLGRLPPNTALMEVTVHGKTYNLFLSTDYKKNASVEFLLQE